MPGRGPTTSKGAFGSTMFGSDIVSMTSTKTGLQEANRQIDSRESQRWV